MLINFKYQPIFKYFLLAITIFTNHIIVAQEATPIKPTQKRSISQREFNKAVQAFYIGGFESALAVHLNNIEKDPLFFDSYFEAIALYKEAGDNANAAALASQLYDLHPYPEQVVELLFVTLVQAHQLEKARMIEELLPIRHTHVDTLFYQAFLAYRLKEYTVATILFEQVLTEDNYFAAAAFFLGLSYQEDAQHPKAIEAFSRTLRIEPNFTSAFYPLAQSQIAMKDRQSALANLRRARNLIPRSDRLNKAIAELEAGLPKPPASSSPQASVQQQRQTNVTVPAIRTFAPAQNNPTIIRVGLVEDIRELQIKTGKGAYRLVADGQTLYTNQPAEGEVLTIKANNQGVNVFNLQNQLIASSVSPIRLTYDNAQLATAVFDIINGAGYYFAAVVTRYYRGELEFMPRPNDRLTLVNQLDMEEYLYSVVPSEMPAFWPDEALKAQAVAARTYALATMGTFKSRGFDLLSSVASQAYTGLSGEHERTTKAVNDTQGMVLYSRLSKKLLVTYFSANHGGYSEYGQHVWPHALKDEHVAVADIKEDNKRKEPIPLYQLHAWLRSRPTTHSNWPRYHSSFAFRGAVWIDNADLSARIARRGTEVGEVLQLISRRRGLSGRSSQVEVIGSQASTTITGDNIRSSLGGLRSNLFTLQTISDESGRAQYFIFHTAGWGHGVGLDQSGSAGMAADSYNWRQILKHYFPNGQLKKYQSNDID